MFRNNTVKISVKKIEEVELVESLPQKKLSLLGTIYCLFYCEKIKIVICSIVVFLCFFLYLQSNFNGSNILGTIKIAPDMGSSSQ